MQNGTFLAAVDLGSNSFRLEIGQLEQQHIQRREYHKEVVRLGGGLDERHMLSPQAMQQGWDCLTRFAERLRGFAPHQVRAVATQTLREALNRDLFLQRAHDILGFPIEVISGPEEARLIFQGVVRLLPHSDEKRLVVDIGGRSTELIVGQHFSPQVMASFRVGSVAWSMKYFAEGHLTKKAFQTAEVAAKAVLDAALDSHRHDLWDVAYGSSGTIGALADILNTQGHAPEVITREGLDWIKEQLIDAGHVDHIKLAGIKEDRRPVIGGGLSILRAVFDLLCIDEMRVAEGALRQGVLYELIAREHPSSDTRASTVRSLCQKFNTDAAQAQRISTAALHFYQQLCPTPSTELAQQLTWAAELHEIGRQISHSSYHVHGAYILDNTDAPGFAMPELHRLGLLVRGHRGKVRKIDTDLTAEAFIRILLCLRLAVIVCHARREPDIQRLTLEQKGQHFELSAPKEWAQRHPQSAYLLGEESPAWDKTPWSFRAKVERA